jgi:hypothetical protein
LGYEWTNLLLSCQVCNRVHKQTHFPLENESDRVKSHPIKQGTLDKSACHIHASILKAENPILLHPAIDQPNHHLLFLKDGSVQGLSEKGRVSIEKYGLNRPDLVYLRKNIVLQIQKDILRVHENAKNIQEQTQRIQWEIERRLSKLVEQIADNQPFTGFRSTLLSNFNTFVIDNEDLGYSLPHKEFMKKVVNDFFEN